MRIASFSPIIYKKRHLIVYQMPLFSHAHAGRGAQGSQDRRCDRRNQLHHKLSRLLLTHTSLLSLVLGTDPKIKLPLGLIVTGWTRDDAAASAGIATAVVGA